MRTPLPAAGDAPQDAQPPPQAVLMTMIGDGLVLSRALGTVAILGVADHLTQEPRHVDEVAKTTHTDPDALFRLLRFLSSVGVFAQDGDRCFTLGPLGGLLVTDAPGSLLPWARYLGQDWYWEAWSHLPTTLRSGKSIHENVHQRRFFEWYGEEPERARAFNAGMTSVSAMFAPAIASGYDYSGFDTLVDVAGGEGSLLATILASHPRLHGALCDQPSVIQHARAAGHLVPFEEAGRAELLESNVFEALPPGRDAYLLKWILHDWNDEESKRILTVCRHALGQKGGKVLLVETIVEEGAGPSMAKTMDVVMMALTGGRERTEEEFRALLSATGFELTRVVPTTSPFSVIEASAV